MGWIGLALLFAALALILTSGWPTYAVLLAVCSGGAALGLVLGDFDAALLTSLPGRVVGLLEHDLLQALALYALVGALLQRLSVADNLYGGLCRLLRRVAPGAAPELAGLGLGALLAPMNGSVGASLLTLARSANRRWAAQGVPPARRVALIALASTLGVIVPPSLVLLLLGDAMMQAHTQGLNIARDLALPLATSNLRIVNTQDVLQAALVPGALMLLGWIGITAWLGRGLAAEPVSAWPRRERWAVVLVPALILTMLVAVTAGRVRAVEAAAGAGLLLLVYGAASRQLSWKLLHQVFDDALALTGALFALLVAATSFSLLLRAFGTDRLIGAAMLHLQGQPHLAVAVVLATLLGCAFVLDAFELVFLVVPIVMPPLLAQVADAAWVAALALLVLQVGFLLPPAGFALVLARGQLLPRPAVGPIARELAPYLVWAALVVCFVAVVPRSTHWLRTEEDKIAPTVMKPVDIDRLMREMSEPAPK